MLKFHSNIEKNVVDISGAIIDFPSLIRISYLSAVKELRRVNVRELETNKKNTNFSVVPFRILVENCSMFRGKYSFDFQGRRLQANAKIGFQVSP